MLVDGLVAEWDPITARPYASPDSEMRSKYHEVITEAGQNTLRM